MPENPQEKLESVKKISKDSASKIGNLKTAYDAGDFHKAFETASSFLVEENYDFTICYLGGLSCLELRKTGTAQDWFERILFHTKEASEQFIAWVSLGKVFTAEKNWERAAECYKKALDLRNEEEVLNNLFQVLYNAGKNKEILEEFYVSGDLSFELKIWQIKALADLRRFDEAFKFLNDLEILTRGNNFDGNGETSKRQWVKFEKLKQDIQQKHESYEVEVQIAKRHVEDGLRYEYEKNLEKSVESYNKALELNPLDPLPWYNLGVIYSKLDKKEEMMESYQRALDLNPDYEKVWYNLGCHYGHLKQREKAIECYDRALQIDPDYSYSIFNKAYEYEGMENYSKAIECYKQYNQTLKNQGIHQEDASAYFNIGWNYKKLDKSLEAIKYYTLTIKVDPSYTKAYNNLAVIFEEIGELKKARAFYKKAIDLDPEYVLARRNLETILEKVPWSENPEGDPLAEDYLKDESDFDLDLLETDKQLTYYVFQNSKPEQKDAEFYDYEKLLLKGIENMEIGDSISLTNIAHILRVSIKEARELVERLLMEKKDFLNKDVKKQDYYVKK
ncbi:MAG: tetratricopeptide repeat protein [Candidatus Hodarchaeales archaeon]